MTDMTTPHQAWARLYLNNEAGRAKADANKAERAAVQQFRQALLDSDIGQALLAVALARHAKQDVLRTVNTARQHLGMSMESTHQYRELATWHDGVPSPTFLIEPLVRAVEEEAERIASERSEEAATELEKKILDNSEAIVAEHEQLKHTSKDDPLATLLNSGARFDKDTITIDGQTVDRYVNLDGSGSLLIDQETGQPYRRKPKPKPVIKPHHDSPDHAIQRKPKAWTE